MFVAAQKLKPQKKQGRDIFAVFVSNLISKSSLTLSPLVHQVSFWHMLLALRQFLQAKSVFKLRAQSKGIYLRKNKRLHQDLAQETEYQKKHLNIHTW